MFIKVATAFRFADLQAPPEIFEYIYINTSMITAIQKTQNETELGQVIDLVYLRVAGQGYSIPILWEDVDTWIEANISTQGQAPNLLRRTGRV